ncbi:zinc knuckle CX2CX4HX4C containing protein, partial [Tanacetum coccineum]
ELWNMFMAELPNKQNVSVSDNNISVPSLESPFIHTLDINKKKTSYVGAAGASTKDQPKVCSNFLPLAKYRLKRIMMNNKGFFFFKFDSRVGLEAVLEGGPWLICKSPIILKKWSIDTKLFKKELTRILIWVKLHDVPIQVFEEDGISLIATFIGKLVMLDSYTRSMCNDSWGQSSFTRCLIKVNSEAHLVDVVIVGILLLMGMVLPKIPSMLSMNRGRPGVIYKTNDGFQTVGKKKKKKGKSKVTNGGQFVSPSVKQNVRYEPKATTSAQIKGTTNVGDAQKKGATAGFSSKNDNIFTSNSYSALNVVEEDKDEVVENVHDETANLFTNTPSGGSSSFTVVAS